jgi:ABC-type sulfate transport system permease subunit
LDSGIGFVLKREMRIPLLSPCLTSQGYLEDEAAIMVGSAGLTIFSRSGRRYAMPLLAM